MMIWRRLTSKNYSIRSPKCRSDDKHYKTTWLTNWLTNDDLEACDIIFKIRHLLVRNGVKWGFLHKTNWKRGFRGVWQYVAVWPYFGEGFNVGAPNVSLMISTISPDENDNFEAFHIILQVGHVLGLNRVKWGFHCWRSKISFWW